MMVAHDHPEFMRADEIRLLIEGIRDHFDARFDLFDIQQKQQAHVLQEVVNQQRITNGQVAKLQLWRAEITGQFNGMKAAAGGAQKLWFVFVGAVSTSIAIAGLAFTIARAILVGG